MCHRAGAADPCPGTGRREQPKQGPAWTLFTDSTRNDGAPYGEVFAELAHTWTDVLGLEGVAVRAVLITPHR